MKFKRLTCFLSVFVIGITSLTLTGCTNDKKVEEAALNALQTKYSKQFEVVDFDSYEVGGTGNRNKKYFGYFKETNLDNQEYPYLTFYVESNKDGTYITDQYCFQRFAPGLASYFKGFVKPSKGQNVSVVADVHGDDSYSITAKSSANARNAITAQLPYNLTIIMTGSKIDPAIEAAKFTDLIPKLESAEFKGALNIIYCGESYRETLEQYYCHALPIDSKVDSD